MAAEKTPVAQNRCTLIADIASVRSLQLGNKAQQGGLAGAVVSDDADAAAPGQKKTNRFQNRMPKIRLAYILDFQHPMPPPIKKDTV
jgi:hypothetical protein